MFWHDCEQPNVFLYLGEYHESNGDCILYIDPSNGQVYRVMYEQWQKFVPVVS
jgi:hypothetical protein